MILILDQQIVETEEFIEKELRRYLNQTVAPVNFSQTNGFKINIELIGNQPMELLGFAKKFLQNLV